MLYFPNNMITIVMCNNDNCDSTIYHIYNIDDTPKLYILQILHRDMKAANVLITKNGVLKLADFGLARAYSSKNGHSNRYTNRVVTLWYRPPELLLGDRNYGPPVDLWGAGCIMAEMWTRYIY